MNLPKAFTRKNKLTYLTIFLSVTTLLLILSAIFLATKVVAQQPQPYVSCDEIRDNEFHSLRPYQASPCGEGPDEEPISALAGFCGNQLVLSDQVSTLQIIPPRIAPNCTQISRLTYECTYNISRNTTIEIDLSNAQFPIAGNTEQDLGDAEKTNEYLSWYLSGVTHKAEGEPINPENEEALKRLVNFSGPLNKLLPQAIQHKQRVETIEKALAKDVNDDEISQDRERHNQKVVCGRETIIDILGIGKTEPVDCDNGGDTYRLSDWDGGLSFLNRASNTIINSLTSILPDVPRNTIRESLGNAWDKRTPPLPWNFEDETLYRKAYNEWRGESCVLVPASSVLVCIDNPFIRNRYADLFPYIPMSSTEDRKGLVSTDSSQVSPASPGVSVSDVSLQTEPAELYFAHTEEVVDLAALLQKTYVPEGQAETGSTFGVSPGESCDLTNIRTNEGDDLFAGGIDGNLQYRAEFSCVFGPNAIGEECSKDVSVGLSVLTQTPKADELWQRLVAGPSGVFKRIFPKVGLGGPILGILDMPGATKVTYDADNLAYVGNPGSNRTGESAELYFPHMGGVHEYFLKGIQTALRPKGFGEPILSGSLGTFESTGEVNCDQNAPEVSVSRMLNKESMFQLALNWVSGRTGNKALECYNDVVRKSEQAGVNTALTFWVWLHESNASNYEVSPRDFGSLGAQQRNFVDQIESFFRTARGLDASNCPGLSNMQAFAYIYATGTCNPNAIVDGTGGQTAHEFYLEFENQWGWITNCPLPNSTTDTSCP